MRAVRLVGAAVALAFVAVAFTPLTEALARRLVPAPALGAADAIIVLGAGLASDGSLNDPSLRRFVHGVRLYRRGLAPVLAFTGGPATQGRGEADVRAALAREIGLPAADIVVVPSARTTREEAVRARDDLAARGVRRILLVTGATHMTRAQAAFVRVGFTVQAAPVSEAAGAYLLTMRRRRLRLGHLPTALAFTVEAVGLGAIFFAVNIGIGVAVGIGSRTLGLGFLPLYLLGDWTLLGISLAQGLIFRRWLAER